MRKGDVISSVILLQNDTADFEKNLKKITEI